MSVLLTQIALGINVNRNTVAKFRFALYDAAYNLLGSSNEVTTVNPVDEIVVGVLTTPLTLQAATTYNLAFWLDDSVYFGFSRTVSQWCGPLQYSSTQAFPTSLTNSTLGFYSGCAVAAMAGLGCTIPGSAITTNPSGSSSTAGSAPYTASSSNGGSNDVSLSKGAVAGIVIGCVVGTNLLLLVCMFLLCGLGRKSNSSGSVHKTRTNSEREPTSRIELATAEPSKMEGHTNDTEVE